MLPASTKPAGPLQRLVPRPLTDRARSWAVTLSLTLIAGLVRLWNLGYPTDRGTPVFDEKHYAPQAWQMLHNGGVEDNPGYELIVHPPVAKQLMAIGEWIFGYNGVGWRFSGAVCGVVLVLLVARIVRRISRSTLVGAIAGVLCICDGVSFVAS
ncbi:MAG TPA: phospholipid carrier-dependent glycosyltransferase, partial [Pseudonocardiaceae bacterium]|nr:phospholipid carrier-dependent glycosyltransferase [Pseudonocardiaceae bacterium]